MPLKASVYTHGCRLNQAESSLIADDLRRAGYEIVSAEEELDLLVLNTCVVTAAAARKSRQTARSIRRSNPAAFIVVTGCGVETSQDAWKQERAVDLIVPNSRKRQIVSLLKFPLEPCTTPEGVPRQTNIHDKLFTEAGHGYYPQHSRANLKVQEGCDFFCSYCIVPYARGKPRSRQWKDVLREASELIAEGHRELVLTGVNIALYNDNRRNFSDLLKALSSLEGDFRIRLSSTEPCAEMTEIIDTIKNSPRICPFLHLPVQYGCDRILKRMGRQYSVGRYRALIEQAVEKVPDICLGSDIIVGFPGENQRDFDECYHNIDAFSLAYLHIFRYSPRPGTPAASYPNQVSGPQADSRRKELQKLADEKSTKFAKSMLGKRLTVLTEERNENGNWEGWTENYLRAELLNSFSNICRNQFVEVTIKRVLKGRRVQCILSGKV